MFELMILNFCLHLPTFCLLIAIDLGDDEIDGFFKQIDDIRENINTISQKVEDTKKKYAKVFKKWPKNFNFSKLDPFFKTFLFIKQSAQPPQPTKKTALKPNLKNNKLTSKNMQIKCDHDSNKYKPKLNKKSKPNANKPKTTKCYRIPPTKKPQKSE